MINDGLYGEFANELQDEDQLDAHPAPGIEIGYDIQRDCGSGSYAEDGPREVREDRPIMNGENVLGSAAMYGPTEIGGIEDEDAMGAVKRAVKRAEQAVKKAAAAVKRAPAAVAAKHVAAAQQATAAAERAVAYGPYAVSGPTEIGESEMGAGLYPVDGASEIGAGLASQEGQSEIGAGEDTLGDDALATPFESFMMGPERIGDDDDELGAGLYPVDGASEIGAGLASQDGQSEIGEGWAAVEGQSEIGAGLFPVDGASEIGDAELGAGLYPVDGASEIGAEYPTNGLSEMGFHDDEWDSDEDIVHAATRHEIGKAAVVKVVEKARDNRQPAPPMKAVDVDAPLEEEDAFLQDIVVGAAVAAVTEPFPLLSQLLLRAGANVEPRIVRIDTEETYKQFRTEQSPALSEVRELRERLEAHIADPNAHELDSEDIDDDIADLVVLGEEAKAAEAQKRVDLWMPKRFDGKVEAWKQGDMVCVSMALPGRDGDVRICTSMEPMRKCIEEMCRHAAEAQVGGEVADVLPEMGCVLGAGTAMKEMAAAAPAILARPEAKMKMPFVVRIEPKTSPNLAALVMLAAACKMGNAQACSEWTKLASMSAPAVKSAMLEAAEVAKAATGG